MNNILHATLNVKVFTYDNEQEMIEHNEKMKQEGWTIKRNGKGFLLPDCNMKDFDKEENWTYFTEYKQEHRKEDKSKPISYESDLYWFSLYKTSKGDN